MPFITHTAGGGWLGGASTTVPNCDTNQQAMINTGLAFVVSTGRPCVAGLAGLTGLATCLGGKNLASLMIDCGGSGCASNKHVTFTPPNTINLCGDMFPDQATTDAAVFHALVLSCGGTEIDAWAIENHCYAGHGTRAPNADERDNVLVPGSTDLGNNKRRGAFVDWDGNTGLVTVTGSGAALSVDSQAYKIPIHLTVGGSWL